MYYLQSRYYNPEWGRFINADALAGQVGELLSHNIFAYCKNNPVMLKDDTGFISVSASDVSGGAYGDKNLGDKPVPLASKGITQKLYDKLVNKVWKVGREINSPTRAGNYPSWNTVRSRYWKNEAKANPSKYSSENLSRMMKGKAPLDEDFGMAKELHHKGGRDILDPHNINNIQEVWPWEHMEIDPYRYYTGPRP